MTPATMIVLLLTDRHCSIAFNKGIAFWSGVEKRTGGVHASSMFELQGKLVSVRYNNRSFWIVRPNATEMYLSRNPPPLDVFRSSACSAEVLRDGITIVENKHLTGVSWGFNGHASNDDSIQRITCV